MKLKILGSEYNLIFSEDLRVDASKFGVFNGTRMVIKLDATTPRARQESTLIHEVLEAIDYELELKLPHRVLSQLEAGLYQVFKDNGLLNLDKIFQSPCISIGDSEECEIAGVVR